MKKYICVSEEKPVLNYEGKSSGIEPKRALFYNSASGRNRVYRMAHTNQRKGLHILILNTKEEAETVCLHTNKFFNDDFKVEELSEEYK